MISSCTTPDLLPTRRTALYLLVLRIAVWVTAASGLALLGARVACAQQGDGPLSSGPAPTHEILGIEVEGVDDAATRDFVRQQSGLAVGQQIRVPGDPATADAVRTIYRLGTFADAEIRIRQRTAEGIYLTIWVEEVPRLHGYSFQGIKKKHRDDLQEQIPLVKRMPVRPADVERSRQIIADFYREKGYALVSVDAEQVRREDGTVDVRFDLNRGSKAEVEEIRIHGNEVFSDRRLRRQMDETKENRWWRFWKGETFDEDAYRTDVQNIIDYYHGKGYYDAHVVSDTFFVQQKGDEPQVYVELAVHEGPRYHIRNIAWEGNTVYSDEALTEVLGLEPGDAYSADQLETNLYGSARGTDVSSLYMDRGYMTFRVEPVIRPVGDDSLDITFDVYEGETYDYGVINIAGNTKTKEHVIRRELYTLPGQTFSRSAITESIRRLQQLGYFAQESLAQGPSVELNEEMKSVDLTYQLEETGSDQLELSGTWASIGLVLQTRFSFNNFSAQNLFNTEAWRPLPAGDGQKLSLSLQTNGRYYQNYSLSFTEPWFRGKPHPAGFSTSFARYDGDYYSSGSIDGHLLTASASAFYNRRLRWPDDKFTLGNNLSYRYYYNDGWSSYLPSGTSQELTVNESISRNSTDHPLYPSQGSEVGLSVNLALPLPGFIQYHKWHFTSDWHVPLANKLTFSVGTDYGYIGSLTGATPQFERFVVGGSPFDTQGASTLFGRDVIYMRGYPAQTIGPRDGDEILGGRILNKYTSELRWLAVQTPQFTAAPYLFLDAANSWDGFAAYSPTQLYRSAGLGARLTLPMLGTIELVYGYNVDPFPELGGDDGASKWRFQFTLGQGF